MVVVIIFGAGIGLFIQKNNQIVYGCDGKTDTEKLQCWEDLTRATLKKQGIEKAFDLIATMHDKDAGFAGTCHAMVHIIGQVAYHQFRSTGEVQLSEKNAFCAFGFYHGFMETLIARKGTIEDARVFCQYVDRTLGEITPGAKYGCYHGIGHGSTDVHNPVYFGNERALVAPALANCEAFSQNSHQLKLCATGVFDSIALAYYNNGENGLVINKDDPLWLCREQPDRYKESCYLDMMPAMIWLGEHALEKAGPILIAHAEKQYLRTAMQSLAENSVRFIIHKKPVTDSLAYCRSLDTHMHLACVGGLGNGVMQFSPPGKEYDQALVFCMDELLTGEEKDVCMKKILAYAKDRYGKQTYADICTTVKEEYKTYCN